MKVKRSATNFVWVIIVWEKSLIVKFIYIKKNVSVEVVTKEDFGHRGDVLLILKLSK